MATRKVTTRRKDWRGIVQRADPGRNTCDETAYRFGAREFRNSDCAQRGGVYGYANNPVCTTEGISAIPDKALPDCAIPDSNVVPPV